MANTDDAEFTLDETVDASSASQALDSSDYESDGFTPSTSPTLTNQYFYNLSGNLRSIQN